MARPKKKGLDYIPLDINFFQQREIKKLIYKHPETITLYLKLRAEIYSNSFYQFFDDEDLEFFARETNISLDRLINYLEMFFRYRLFSRRLFEEYNILTSLEIYNEYVSIKKSSKSKLEFSGFEKKVIDTLVAENNSELTPSNSKINSGFSENNSELTPDKSRISSEFSENNFGLTPSNSRINSGFSENNSELTPNNSEINSTFSGNNSEETQNFSFISKVKESKEKGSEVKEKTSPIFRKISEIIPKELLPKTLEETLRWERTLTELKKELTEAEIIRLVKFALTDKFWKQNFLALPYLTHKSKTDGVEIWRKIHAQMKADKSKSTGIYAYHPLNKPAEVDLAQLKTI